MELTNIHYLASSSSGFFYSSYSRCALRSRRVGKTVITASATGSRAEPYDGSIIQSGVRNVLTKAKAAGMLHLVFHDAGTFDIGDKSGGMNGSISYEVDKPENTGLNRSIKILGKAKEGIDNVQKVALCGGPEIPVRLGRLDSSTADPAGKLPEETLDATALKTLFSKKGFSTQEMVVFPERTQLEAKDSGVQLFSITPISKYSLRSLKHLHLAWQQCLAAHRLGTH